jgi:GT2 family glycosyltransferase
MLGFFDGNKIRCQPEAPARASLAGASGSFDLKNLQPWQELEPVPDSAAGTWRASGVDPQFRAVCRLPARWVRIRLKMTCADRARVELLADTGRGFHAADCLERFSFRESIKREFFVNLPCPVRAFRFDPRDSPGTFQLEEFEITSVSRFWLLKHSLWNMIRTNPVRLARPIWALLRGRWKEFKKILLHNVPGPSALAPPLHDADQAYAEWRRQRQLTEADRKHMRQWIAGLQRPPLISVIVPVPNDSVDLSCTIESVRKQRYPHWELLFVDRTRSASKGDLVTFLNPGDTLSEHALFQVARAIVAEPDLDMLYSDEDRIDEDGRHVEPFFKPDWSPETLRSFHYTGGLAVYRADLVRELGFKLDEGIEEYDLALRIAGRFARVKHVADVLYHRRVPPAPRANDLSLPVPRGTGRLPHPLPLVSIIVPTAYQADFFLRCLESIHQKSTYPNYEILVLDNNAPPPEMLETLRDRGIGRMPYALPFNWARTMNQGAAVARGDHFLILDDDTEVISPDWIERLLEYSLQKEIGVVGARLQFPDGRLQHAGVTILDGIPGHPFYGYPEDHPGYFFSSVLPRNYSAVTGACLMTKAEVFRSVNGFDESFASNFNDVDYCLRVRQKGWRVVCNPHVRLIHHETATKSAFLSHELAAFQKRWKHLQDPYSNRNLCKRFHDFRIGTKS